MRSHVARRLCWRSQSTFRRPAEDRRRNQSRYNIAPREGLVAITNEEPEEMDLLEWGFLPNWADDYDGRIDDADAHHIMGDTETATEELLDDVGIDDEHRLDDDDVSPVAQDGGTLTHQPERFETMLGPQELEQAGPALEWDELRDIVADENHWSSSLEIHPDRVQPGTLKSNHERTPRIIAAIARHEAQGGYVTTRTVEKLVASKLRHLQSRRDSKAGMAYIKQTYIPLVATHLGTNPRADRDGFIVDEEMRTRAFESNIDSPWTRLQESTELTPATVLAPTKWQETRDMARFEKATWHADLGNWLADVATLAQIAEHVDVPGGVTSDELAVTVPDTQESLRGWLEATVAEMLTQFQRLEAKRGCADIVDVVLENHVGDGVADIIRSRLR